MQSKHNGWGINVAMQQLDGDSRSKEDTHRDLTAEEALPSMTLCVKAAPPNWNAMRNCAYGTIAPSDTQLRQACMPA